MARASARQKSTRRSQRKTSLVEGLKPEEAQAVLARLLTVRPALRPEVERVARLLLGEISFKAVADEVERVVRALDLDDLQGRSGRKAWGYVEPTEAAWEILGEAVEPFLDDMKRRIRLGLEAEALELCKGVLLGLYRVREEKSDELLGWAPDFPEETAAHALETWRGGARKKPPAGGTTPRRRPEFPRDFVAEFLPDWARFLTRMLSRRPA